MSKSMVTGVVLGVAVATAAGSIAGYRMLSGDEYAQVISVTPITERVETPKEECQDVAVTRQAPVQDEYRLAGSAVGAVAGALAGDALGGGGKNTGAKIAGAVVGGVTGNKIQENMQKSDTYQTTERRCETVTEVSERTAGYEVEYQLGENTGKVKMDYDPGSVIPVRDGQLVLSR
ncbi:MAG: glycine zipper 2TM domain-containing protein [Pseudomonadota bacterium]